MTIVRCASMWAMGEMRMPGGWGLSMVWVRMPGQTWSGAATSFAGMWLVMMVAMMLPSLTPTLWRYGVALGTPSRVRAAWLTALVGVGYFVVWAVIGMIVFPSGLALATIAAEQPALARGVPTVAGAAVLIAGVVQHTDWKARHLAFCREVPGRHLTPVAGSGAAWRHGLCLGCHCVRSCVGLTTVMLALGVMDLRVMALVAAAITAERLAPHGERVTRVVGAVVVGAGLLLMAGAASAPRP
jgi:predicted metal-binding membrane protein